MTIGAQYARRMRGSLPRGMMETTAPNPLWLIHGVRLFDDVLIVARVSCEGSVLVVVV